MCSRRLISGLVAGALLAPAGLAGDPEPSPRHHHAMVYDSARSSLLVFGGNVEAGGELTWSSETWELRRNGWRRLERGGPPALSSHALAYHQDRKLALLLGGVGADRQLSAGSWVWNGERWRPSEGGPSARHSPAIGYDLKRKRVVVFGGSGRGSDPMWEWDGEIWHAVTLTEPHPPALMRAGFSFDPVRGEMLLFGGYHGGVHGDTWSWNGRRWVKLDVSGPPPRANHAMATDPRRKRVVLFGGSDADRELHGDTWEWDGKQWRPSGPEQGSGAPEGPAPRTVPAMAFDPGRGRMLMYGGRGEGRKALGDLWEWNGAVWRQARFDEPADP